MKHFLISLLVALPGMVFAAPVKTVTLEVNNMTCSVCPITVKKSLVAVEGVETVEIDLDDKTATVTYDPDKTQEDTLTAATNDAGYPSTVKTDELQKHD
ncbi:MAG: mercury resistance system periplasmic binding protein MerP [Candidatus Thiothrix moscowensis]|nr:mercury resistance system periplasmic binding protein MerP [Candidatus Thiothrix moscowensis]